LERTLFLSDNIRTVLVR